MLFDIFIQLKTATQIYQEQLFALQSNFVFPNYKNNNTVRYFIIIVDYEICVNDAGYSILILVQKTRQFFGLVVNNTFLVSS